MIEGDYDGMVNLVTYDAAEPAVLGFGVLSALSGAAFAERSSGDVQLLSIDGETYETVTFNTDDATLANLDGKRFIIADNSAATAMTADLGSAEVDSAYQIWTFHKVENSETGDQQYQYQLSVTTGGATWYLKVNNAGTSDVTMELTESADEAATFYIRKYTLTSMSLTARTFKTIWSALTRVPGTHIAGQACSVWFLIRQ